MKKLRYKLLQIVTSLVNVGNAAIAFHYFLTIDHPARWLCLLLCLFWLLLTANVWLLIDVSGVLLRLYYRRKAIWRMLNSYSYILHTTQSYDASCSQINHNYVHHEGIIGRYAEAAKQLSEAEQSLDTLTNELNIKRSNDQ